MQQKCHPRAAAQAGRRRLRAVVQKAWVEWASSPPCLSAPLSGSHECCCCACECSNAVRGSSGTGGVRGKMWSRQREARGARRTDLSRLLIARAAAVSFRRRCRVAAPSPTDIWCRVSCRAEFPTGWSGRQAGSSRGGKRPSATVAAFVLPTLNTRAPHAAPTRSAGRPLCLWPVRPLCPPWARHTGLSRGAAPGQPRRFHDESPGCRHTHRSYCGQCGHGVAQSPTRVGDPRTGAGTFGKWELLPAGFGPESRSKKAHEYRFSQAADESREVLVRLWPIIVLHHSNVG